MTAAGDPFDDFIGHRAVVELLRAEAEHPSQAYLFTGPASTGKAAAALRFIAILMGGADPDDRRRVMAGSHPDVVVVEPAGRTSITVDQARRAVSQASLAPLEGSRKVFLFEEAGAMNDEAANALLKTLEEPTASTVFVLVTESEDDLPDTIASRCRTVVFGRVLEEEIVHGLRALGIDDDQSAQAARISGGRPGLAVALATRPEVAAFRNLWLSIPMRLPAHPGDAYLLAEEAVAACEPLLAAIKERQQDEIAGYELEGGEGRALRDRHEREMKRASHALYVSGLEILAGFYRDVAAAQFGARARNPDLSVAMLTTVTPQHAVANAERVLETVEALQANQRPPLALAVLFADLGARG
jgi:DNA polymerase-3 subunit delta'